MEKLKQYVDSGVVQLAKLDQNNKPTKIQYSQVADSISRQQKNASIYKQVQSLSWDEKYEWVTLKRLKAKQYYQNKQYDQAMQTYMESLIGLDLHDETNNRLQQMKQQLKYPIILNIATCLYMKKQYQKGIALCDKVLVQDEHNLPAIYKKAYLLKHVGDYEQARKLLAFGISIAKNKSQQDHLKNLINLHGELHTANNRNKNIYAKMFNLNNKSKQIHQKDTQQSQLDESSSLNTKQTKTGTGYKQSNEQQVLYYEDEAYNICSKMYKKIRNTIYKIFPSLDPKVNISKQFLRHSRSL